MVNTTGNLECRSASLGDRMVLVAGATTNSNCADDLSVLSERYPSREDHDLAVVRRVDSEKLSAGLRMRRQIFGGDVESTRRVSLLL